METHRFKVTARDAGDRLDRFLALQLTSCSRSRIQQLIRERKILVNGLARKSHFILAGEEEITVEVPDPPKLSLEPEEIPLEILHEDEAIVVVDKPAGLVVHPGAGNYRGTLVNALLFRCKKLAGLGSPLRPGIVHRLDKETSGLMVAVKTDEAYLDLVEQFRGRAVEKKYLALVKGTVQLDRGVIDLPLGRHKRNRQKMAVVTDTGKPAYTTYEVKKRYGDSTLLELGLKTGRTHQIRVHLAHLGYPLCGDARYGTRGRYPRQMLHACSLSFRHPVSGQMMRFTSLLPGDFRAALGSPGVIPGRPGK